MANTEKLNAIRIVREAKNAVSSARFEADVKAGDRRLLERAYNSLHRLEDAMILEELKDIVDSIKRQCAQLSAVSGEMKANVKKLEGVAELIEKAAKAVGTLADIAAKVASAGLL